MGTRRLLLPLQCRRAKKKLTFSLLRLIMKSVFMPRERFWAHDSFAEREGRPTKQCFLDGLWTVRFDRSLTSERAEMCRWLSPYFQLMKTTRTSSLFWERHSRSALLIFRGMVQCQPSVSGNSETPITLSSILSTKTARRILNLKWT